MSVVTIRTAAETALADAFGVARDALPGAPAVKALRDEAFGIFSASGLPHRRVEDWKYTDLRVAMREAKPLAKAGGTAPVNPLFDGVEAIRVGVVDGAVSSVSGALPAGVTIRPLADLLAAGEIEGLGAAAPKGGNAALSLNAAFMSDGVVIDVAAGVVIEVPILIEYAHSRRHQAVYVRSLARLGRGAAATLVETHAGPGGNQTNTVLDLSVAEGGRFTRVKAQGEALDSLHLGTLVAELGAQATLASVTLTAGAAMTRNQIFVTYAGEGATATLAGATLVGGKRHADTTLVMDHAQPGGISRELFKAVVDGEGRSVFQGKIIVRPGAQKTDGQMMNASLLLSDDAEVDAKPELEIFADDVVCAHGATIGALDEDLLFYLKARGIPPKEAERLLVQAFLGEAFELVEHDGIRDALNGAIDRWLNDRL